MFQDTKTFIHGVRNLACNLSIEELGSDPTVQILTDAETQELTRNTERYPNAVVLSNGSNPRQRCTVWLPIWTSFSFLGRTTNVWRVREHVVGVNQKPLLQGDDAIMRIAWRSSTRTPGSDIYMSVDQLHKGLAKFGCGGNVKHVSATVQNLRSHPIHNSLPEGDTPVLRYLILSNVGRPLWEYTSDLDLLTGFRDALEAHKALCDQGILHCDINAGNVLLIRTQNAPLRGFITDLDFARIASSTLSKSRVTITNAIGSQNRYDDRARVLSRTQPTTSTHIIFESTIKQDASMTRTAQFMAWRILLQEAAVDDATYNVESFVWVLSYCVMRSLYHRASQQSSPEDVHDQCHTFRYLLRQTFSQTSTQAIATERQSRSYALNFPKERNVSDIITNFMSDALVVLFKDLQGLIHRDADPFNPIPLTHDALLAVVNRRLASL